MYPDQRMIFTYRFIIYVIYIHIVNKCNPLISGTDLFSAYLVLQGFSSVFFSLLSLQNHALNLKPPPNYIWLFPKHLGWPYTFCFYDRPISLSIVPIRMCARSSAHVLNGERGESSPADSQEWLISPRAKRIGQLKSNYLILISPDLCCCWVLFRIPPILIRWSASSSEVGRFSQH